MTINRNLNLDLAIRQIRILNDHIDRTINVLTRGDLNFTSVRIDYDRDNLAVLILRGDLGVLIWVVDDDASALLVLSRINRLHIRIINRGLSGSSFFLFDRDLRRNRLTRAIRIRH